MRSCAVILREKREIKRQRERERRGKEKLRARKKREKGGEEGESVCVQSAYARAHRRESI